mmetsp:Transcript_77770/g.251705  ORF Transcript_77770/g.251705 Transcript_77770/m.251705 type:complete len:504 (+) Transcript_77770:46-1557(+)
MPAAMKAWQSLGETDALDVASYFTKSFYHKSIIPMVIITVFLAWRARPSIQEEMPRGFRSFQARYLSVWIFCVAADWLQGPYVYALYSAYNFSRHEIAQLFVCGFGSSLAFSLVVGSVCDRFGRKKCALLYCLLYISSCLTKHVKMYWVLMFGRVTGGIATSLLFSCFECWMVSEHLGRNRFSPTLLSYMFGTMFTTMYCVAIISGIVGEFLNASFVFKPIVGSDVLWMGGNLAPFDLAIVCLVVGGVLIAALWGENYGRDEDEELAPEASVGLADGLKDAVWLLGRDRRMWLLGLVVACFEGSMYAFVFNWTPALTEEGAPKPPYGHIFATFMAMSMLGSQAFSLESGRRSVESIGRYTLLLAAACHVVPVLTSSAALRFLSFLAFEMCVGLYFPMMGTMKGMCVPEESRAAIYNMYRVPLNVIVVSTLVTNISVQTAFMLTSGLLLAAVYFQTKLIGLRGNAQYRPVGADSEFGLDDDPLGIDGQPTGAGSELTTVVGNKS